MLYSMKSPREVYSGENVCAQLGALLHDKCSKAAVFTDNGIQKSGILDIPFKSLRDQGIPYQVLDGLPAEPTCDQAQEVVDRFRSTKADCIIAIGGGSVMDVAKLASIAATDQYSIRDLLKTPLLGKKTVRTVMIPTTAGTGAEATPNSIVCVPEQELKVGIVNGEMIPDLVLLDGAMIRKLPKAIAASTGIDALCHAIECYTSKKANPFSNLYAMESLKLIFANLEKACEDPDAVEEKTRMLLAAFYAGMAISASGTTAVHALSYPLGGKYHLPHGVSNAMLLMPVMRFNQEACQPELLQISEALGHPGDSGWLLQRMEDMVRRLEIPTSLTAFGIGRESLDELVTAGMDVQRLLVNNKRDVTPQDARRLYLEIMEEETAHD